MNLEAWLELGKDENGRLTLTEGKGQQGAITQ